MTTTDPPRRRRTREWILAVAVPLILVGGCTRPADPASGADAGTIESPPDTSVEPTTADTTPAGSTTDESTTDTSEPDDVLATEPVPTGADEASATTGVADDSDVGTSDPAAITIGAIIGAGLLLAVAALWMVRVNRVENDTAGVGEAVDGSTPDDRDP